MVAYQRNAQPAGLVARKVRKIVTPLDCAPPEDAPAWALAMDSSKSCCVFLLRAI